MLPALALLFAALPASAAPSALAAVRAAELSRQTLFLGARSAGAFKAATLEPAASAPDLVRQIGSRLMSSASSIVGLTGNAHTAGAFALGVRDGQARSVRLHGAERGMIGVTRMRVMSAQDFAALLDRFGKTSRGVVELQRALGAMRVAVDASRLLAALAPRYPGILTSGFREMIDAALSREAEYFVFGRKPAFARVVAVSKDQVVARDGSSDRFDSKLAARLLAPRPKTTVRPVKPAARLALPAAPATRLLAPPRPRLRQRVGRWLRALRPRRR